jgi:hypothetical protein
MNLFHIEFLPSNLAAEKQLVTNDRIGSVAVVQTHSSSMTGLGHKADIRPSRTAGLTNSGHSVMSKYRDLNGS